ncbi:MAG: ferrochelatase, partial [Deltaproteobacteria bacterium]|nr:ferrochelatase [Deltaproteobacteria bacterium]
VPVYVGMRNWHPLLEETVSQMHRDGVERAVVQILSVFQSQSSWNDYQNALAKAVNRIKPQISFSYADPPYDQPGFYHTMTENISRCLAGLEDARRPGAHILFAAHSLPLSDPDVKRYVRQIQWTAEQVSRELAHPNWHIVYQSRSGRPQDPWLTPDINETLRELAAGGVSDVVAAPIGFVCDNIEVLYDLDTQARQTANRAGIGFSRARTVENDPRFIDALADLVTRAATTET